MCESCFKIPGNNLAIDECNGKLDVRPTRTPSNNFKDNWFLILCMRGCDTLYERIKIRFWPLRSMLFRGRDMLELYSDKTTGNNIKHHDKITGINITFVFLYTNSVDKVGDKYIFIDISYR